MTAPQSTCEAADAARRSHAGTLLALVEEESRVACRQRLDEDLDTLTAEGLLTDADRARLATDQGTEHLSRLLRSFEQAGHDPLDVLRDAVTSGRSLADAVSVAQVLATRIHRGAGDIATLPTPDVTAEPTLPARIDPDRIDYLAQLRRLLTDRELELGQALAAYAAEAPESLPQWATEALGPLPPADEIDADTAAGETDVEALQQRARAEWAARAGRIAAHREATDWDHPTLPLGRCPGVSSPEKRAAWHAAYTAAGRPEERRPEAEMTDGRLLVRLRAAERALTAAPPSVYDAQREHHRLADFAARESVLARASGREDDAARLEADLVHHREHATRFDEAAHARALWLIEHSETLSAGDAAREELTRRGITPGREPDRVTAQEWLQADAEARAADDAHRTITEADLADQREAEQTAAATTADAVDTRHQERAMASASRTAGKREIGGGFTRSELDLIHAMAKANGTAVNICSTVVPDGTFPPSPDGRPRREVAQLLQSLQRERMLDSKSADRAEADRSATEDLARDDSAVAEPASTLLAQATATEIAAATAKAAVTLDELADFKSQDATAPVSDADTVDRTSTADDDWHYLRTRSHGTTAGDETADYDSTADRDQAYEQSWDDMHDAGDVSGFDLVAGDE